MRRLALALLVLFLALVLLPARGSAQLTELLPGARVRLTAPGADRVGVSLRF